MKQKVEIDIWDNKQVQEHLDARHYPIHHNSSGDDYIKGFEYLSPKFLLSRFKSEDNYENSLQDRNVVALDDSGLVGIAAFLYQDKPLSHFFPRFLEVRSDRLHRGVATALVKRLAEPCFLWGSTLMLDDFYYTTEGYEYLKKIIDKEWFQGKFRIMSNVDDI